MKALLRLCWITLIVLGIIIQFTRGRRSEADSDLMASLAAGLEQLGVQTEAPTAAGILTGHAQSCEQPLHVMLVGIDGAEEEWLGGISQGQSGSMLRYVYLGSVDDTRDRAAMFGRWIWADVLFTVGLRPAKPRPKFVLVVLPKTCPELAALRWSVLSPWS
jgi:hypothetical protein